MTDLVAVSDLVAVKWTDGSGRVRWGVDDSEGRRLGWYTHAPRIHSIGFYHPDSGWRTSVRRFRTEHSALRVGRRVLRRHLRRSWTNDD